MTKVKVVLDTNVILSGIIFGGNSRHLLDLIIARKVTAFTSTAILLETAQKLTQKFKWPKNQIVLTIKTLGQTIALVKTKIKLDIVKADKSDNKIIEAALEAKADCVITGDKHLLALKKYGRLKILSPADFLTRYFSKD